MKEVDITLYGATGFTGQYVLQHALSLLGLAIGEKRDFPRLAIAGRSMDRLSLLLERISSSSSVSEVESNKEQLKQRVRLIEADANNPESLAKMAKLSRVVINLTGPYRTLGEPVVKACIENNCDYVDITGEPEVSK